MDRRITVRLDSYLADWIADQGKKEGVTMASLVRSLLEANMTVAKTKGDPHWRPPEDRA